MQGAGIQIAELCAGETKQPPSVGWRRRSSLIFNWHRLAAAEEEIRLSRVPDRPMAFFVVELDQRAALTDRDDVVDQLRLGLEVVFVSRARCEGGIAAYRRSHAPEQVRR